MHAGKTLPPEVCDPQRAFNTDQRRMLQRNADGMCERCAEPVGGQFHAHHMVPWSAGGATTVRNGKCVCSPCHSKEHRTINRRGLTNVFSAKQIDELRYWRANQWVEGEARRPEPAVERVARVAGPAGPIVPEIDLDFEFIKILVVPAMMCLVFMFSMLYFGTLGKWVMMSAAAVVVGVKLSRLVVRDDFAAIVVPSVIGTCVAALLTFYIIGSM